MTIPPDVSVMRIEIDPRNPEASIAGIRFSFTYAGDEPLSEPIVLYMLDRYRLLTMLEAARAGHSMEDLFLALDAAALNNGDT